MSPSQRTDSFHLESRQRAVRFDEGRVRAFLATLARDLAGGRDFSVVVSDDDCVRATNRQFRSVDRATDVLSFPDGEDGYMGDILISAGVAASQAAELGHTVEEEIQTLALHGLLHLAGFDHETDDGEMRRAEDLLRRKYGLPTGLIGRIAEG